jgi:hypothetical protein
MVQVPCSRCVSKQIVCQSRATRRSSQAPSRRGNTLPRPHSERALHASAAFHISQLSSPPHDGTLMSPGGFFTAPEQGWSATNQYEVNFNAHPMSTHRLSLPEIGQALPMTNGLYAHEIDPPQHLRNGFSQTPSDANIPITPVMPNMPQMENFVSMNGNFDSEGDSPFLSMSSGQTSSMDYDMSTMLDLMSPPGFMQEFNDQLAASGKGIVQTPNHISIFAKDSPAYVKSRLDMDSPPQYAPYRMQARSPLSPTSLRGLQEPDAVINAQQAWPFFQCNPVEKPSAMPPKTASIYLEGLAQTLRNPDIWRAWIAQSQLDDGCNNRAHDSTLSAVPMESQSREKLLAIMQSFLHKALDIHRTGPHSGKEESRGSSPDSTTGSYLMLPPPEVMQSFLTNYTIRYQPYYPCVSGGRLDPNSLMQLNNGKAPSLLLLLMLASGAISTSTVEARYLASGMTEACRISLFDLIEKDVFQARDPIVLQSALHFTTLAAWSGDKWHMDVSQCG